MTEELNETRQRDERRKKRIMNKKNMIKRERWFDKRRSNEKTWLGLNKRKNDFEEIENGGKERKIIRKDKKKKEKKQEITFLFHSFKMLCISYIIFFLQTSTYSAFSLSHVCFLLFFFLSCFLLFLLVSFFLSFFFFFFFFFLPFFF